MASADVVHEGPGNTSQDSGGSGSHKSMLELLSITDAAVKALNKSTRSLGSTASQASGKSLDSDRSVRSAHSEKSGHSVSSHRSQGSHHSLNSQKSQGSHHSVSSQKSQSSHQSVRSYQSGQVGEAGLPLKPEVDEVSCDSGVVSKTQTASEPTQKKGTVTQGIPIADSSLHERSSDESTTASDVLIRSTLDKSERSIHETNGSSISKCSKSSYGVENFNSSGPHKIKISRKHLREIKPFDDGQNPRSSSDSDGKVPSSLLGKEHKSSSKSGSNSSGSSESKSSRSKSDSQKDIEIASVGKHKIMSNSKVSVNVIRNTNGAPSFPKGIDNAVTSKEPLRKVAEKPITLGRTEGHVVETGVERKADFAGVSKSDIRDTNINANRNGTTTEQQFRSTTKYFIERHTPQKVQPSKDQEELSLIPERRNLMQDLEDSVEITTVQGKDSSSSSSQPDILTVPERIVTISATASISPSSSISDLAPQTFTPPTVTVHEAGKQVTKSVSAEPAITHEPGQKPFAGTSHVADNNLRPTEPRGSAVVTEEDKYFDYRSVERSFMGECTQNESRHIPPALPRSHFEKEPEDKLQHHEQLLPTRFQKSYKASSQGLRQGAMVDGMDAPDKQKTSDDVEIVQSRLSEKQKAREIFARRQGGPVKRVVQPQIVGHQTKSTSQTGEHQVPQLGQSNDQVLTAAAAASAAVAATQPFLKAQYEMEARMAEVLSKISELQAGGVKAPEKEPDRVQVLEKQLADVTEKRIEYMEKLQEQQMAMQAKLLSMTKGTVVSRPHLGPRSPEHIHRRQETSTPTAGQLNKAFTKTVINKPLPKGDNSERQYRYTMIDGDESNSPLDTPAPRSRAPKPTSYDTSDIEFKARQKARSKSRSPAKRDTDPGILRQILASAGSPAREKVQPQLQLRHYDTVQSPNVKKAKDLVEDLSQIKDQVKHLVEDTESWKPKKTEQSQTQTTIDTSAGSQPGPSPLDQYLDLPEKGPTSPYKSFPDLSQSQFNAQVPPGFKDAENILKQVQKNRGYLESNMEAVLRARQEVEVFSLLEALYHDSSNKEKARIQKLVDSSIAKLRREVEREVTDDLVLAEMKKQKETGVPGAVKVPAPALAKPVPKYGLRGRLAEPKVEPKKPAVKRPGVAGKENLPQKTKPVAKKAKSMFENEEYMTRIYGKASYQKGRTTVKDPYLHYQNVPKHKAERPPGTVEAKGKEKMSSKTQTTGAVKQFYFNPSTGTYIPITTAATAPIPGHLIPMAVPLGGPRMDPGLTTPVSMTQAPDSVTFDPSKQTPQVTAARNVAVVTVPIDEEEQKHSPELGKQVLPAVDIDTDLSEMSELTEEAAPAPVVREKKRVQIQSPDRSLNKSPTRSPGKAHYEVVYHEDSREEQRVEDKQERESNNSSSSATPSSLTHPKIVEDKQGKEITHSSLTQPKVSPDIHYHEPEDEQIVEEMKEEQYSSGTTTRSSLTPTKISPVSNDESFSDEDAGIETATGIELPGYQPTEASALPYNGPIFPPKQPSTDRQLTADLIAEDIKRRDLLQNKATEWLEQELMARIITEVYPLPEKEEPAEISHVVSEGSEESYAEDKEQSMFVMDRIGRTGLQLFVDAGCPVDNKLVTDLTKDVLLEKIHTMLGQRPDQEVPSLSTGATTVLQQQGEEIEEEIAEQIPPRQAPVRTPEPTPKASPTSSPTRRRSPAATPPASPPLGSPREVQQIIEPPVPMVLPAPIVEPESEPTSESLDIQAELQRLAGQLKPDIDASVSQQTLHDVPTPPDSPKPEPVVAEVYRPLTPPDLSPRPVVEDMMPAKISLPAGTSQPLAPKIPEPPPVEVAAPEPLEEEEIMEQPKPVMFTVAGTQTEAEKTVQVPTPEPKPRSKSPSESSYTESSSISETFNECVSEGQWLISKSDGEVADFPIDEDAVRQRMLRSSHRKVDVSSASTWKDIDDVDLEDMTDVSKSEGEFLYKTPLPPEQDPVLDLLARLQSSSPQYGVQQMSSRQVNNVLNVSGKSVGEVTPYGTGKSEGEVIQRSQPKKPVREVNPAFQSQPQMQRPQTKSGGKRAQSPTRVSFEENRRSPSPGGGRSPSPARGILKQPSKGINNSRSYYEEEPEESVRDTGLRTQSPAGRITPGGRVSQGRGPTVSAGGRVSPKKSAMRPGKPPQVIKSSTLPDSHGTGSRGAKARRSSEEFRDSAERPGGSGYYSSELGTRSMTPDQMNVDALIQSGYLSQSFSQSDTGRLSADPRRSYGAGSTLKSSGDMRESRTSAGGRSLGYSYGTEGSVTESELQRLAEGSGVLKMSLTIPGTGEFDEASDLSEIDITDGGNTR